MNNDIAFAFQLVRNERVFGTYDRRFTLPKCCNKEAKFTAKMLNGVLQSSLFFTQDSNGVLLNEWTSDFLANDPGWIDIVEDAVP